MISKPQTVENDMEIVKEIEHFFCSFLPVNGSYHNNYAKQVWSAQIILTRRLRNNRDRLNEQQ